MHLPGYAVKIVYQEVIVIKCLPLLTLVLVFVFATFNMYVGFVFKSDVSNHWRFAMLIEWLLVSLKSLMITLVIKTNLTCFI